jgi:hypothetical protein
MQLNVYRFNMRPLLCLQPTHGCVSPRTVPFKAAGIVHTMHDSSLAMHGHVQVHPFLVLKSITSVEHLEPSCELSVAAHPAYQPPSSRSCDNDV